MDRCKPFHVIVSLINALFFCIVEINCNQFSWSRLIFNSALMVLLQSFQLVRNRDKVPNAIYHIYKGLAASILSYVGTALLFSQMEDFLLWALILTDKMFECIPMLKFHLRSNQSVHSVATVLVSLKFLHWVLVYVKLLPSYELRLIIYDKVKTWSTLFGQCYLLCTQENGAYHLLMRDASEAKQPTVLRRPAPDENL